MTRLLRCFTVAVLATMPGRTSSSAQCVDCTIRITKEVQIGPDDRLLDTSKIVRDSAGYFYVAPVVDRGTIAIYSPDGTYLRSIGRRGQGPGEFERISYHFMWPADTLAVVSGPTITLLTREGRYVRSFVSDGQVRDASLDSEGRIFAVQVPMFDQDTGPIVHMAPDGTTLTSIGPRASRSDHAGDNFLREVAASPRGIATIRRDRHGLQLFSGSGRYLGGYTATISWLQAARNPFGRGGSVIDLAIRGDTAWILLYRYNFEAQGNRNPPSDLSGEVMARRRTVEERIEFLHSYLEVVDLSAMERIAVASAKDRLVVRFIDPAHLYTIETEQGGNIYFSIWRTGVVPRH